MKWRPISSAPKDQQILLACMENGEDFYVCQGRWVDVPHSNTFMEAWRRDLHLTAEQVYANLPKEKSRWMECHIGYMQGNIRYTYEYRASILFHPSHWMPLPKGPTSRAAYRKARKIAGQD